MNSLNYVSTHLSNLIGLPLFYLDPLVLYRYHTLWECSKIMLGAAVTDLK